MSELSKEDKLLLEQAFTDVKPLNQDKLKHKTTLEANRPDPPTAHKSKRRPQNDMSNPADSVNDEIRNFAITPSGGVSWFHPGLRPQDLKKLRNGQYPCQAALDLHGFTQEQATQALLNFLRRQRQAGARSLRIVHGKGYNSASGPIIKHCVLDILSQYPDLLGVCSALPKDGDTGALYLLFRKVLDKA